MRALAASLDRACPRINVLVNNAGGIFGDRAKTVDGFEKTFQVNHLAPFLLTNLLMDKLLASRASVIQTSSSGARLFGKLNIDDLDHDRDFTPQLAYGTAKLENILFTRELRARYHAEGLSAAAFNPGAVRRASPPPATASCAASTPAVSAAPSWPPRQKGAGQMVWLAETTPGTNWQSGTYYEKQQAGPAHQRSALDPTLTVQLWDRSTELVGRKFTGARRRRPPRRSSSAPPDNEPTDHV